MKGRPFAAIDRYYFGSPHALTIHRLNDDRTSSVAAVVSVEYGLDANTEAARVDVCQTGVRLLIESSLEGLALKEFFLLLSSTGLAYRRCHLVRVAGDQIGVTFLARDALSKRKSTKKRSTDQIV